MVSNSSTDFREVDKVTSQPTVEEYRVGEYSDRAD
jgi:hypothetical protein